MGIGEKHAQTYLRHPECNIISLCDFDSKKINKLKKDYNSILVSKDYKSIINNKDIDLVSIASYDNFHATQIIESINNHKHVFAEKPLCLTVEELKEIDKIAPSIPSNFGINWLYSPGPNINFNMENNVPKFSKKAVNE